MARHGWFDGPDKQGWFDYEKCAGCGQHYRFCTCDREKGHLEKGLEFASQFDICTHVGALTGVPPGCLLILCILGAILMVAVFGGE